MIIEIITLGKAPRGLLAELSRDLEKTYAPLVESCVVGASLEIPPAAHNPSRNQYNADLILNRVIHRITGENKVLALLDVDLYVPDKNFVFGLAQYLGRIAVVSLKRLNPTFYGASPNNRLMLERATKEAIHELGHAFGLEHCLNRACVMSFSNSILDVDRKGTTLCKNCRRKLQTTFTIRIWR